MTPVRVGTARDVEPALAVWRACEQARSQPPGTARTTRTRDRLRSPSSLLLVTGEPVVGVLLVELVAKRLEVALLCVQPSVQRTGVARSLVEALRSRYPAVAAWSEQPEVCEALGLVRTGELRDEQVELVLSPAGA